LIEALHESLATEVSRFGINVTLIEPGAYATDFSGPSSLKIAEGMDAYAGLRQQVFEHDSQLEFGDPQATIQAIFHIVDAEQPPLRVFRAQRVCRCYAKSMKPDWLNGKNGSGCQTQLREHPLN
jgi:NAD(P)-dependent dehydrogenase (short-subunit alcohol dehydrogenase family)